ncbi:MAG: bifunctional phosphoribosylaminoimidazolecarboxamide formyltransferase/IMP cyclohydrolase [Bacteriovoracaceae bacterium]|nr:bifunctional phosphoribosylaminoimidazolecarboxamide formyltransferase/IMP cyclohydrolase [Bacteriovoracaceae bacterium]
MDLVKIKTALISVSDKSLLDELSNTLHSFGVEIISSGGTGRHLKGLGIPYTPIQEVTGNPEAFNGRMKTISFQVSSALLFRRDSSEDIAEAKHLGINAIDLVVCNLYPFLEVVKKNGDDEELIENIDVGGPTMIRAAAKNFKAVTVCTNPEGYDGLIEVLKKHNGHVDYQTRKDFALFAFEYTANYDLLIANALQKRWGSQKVTIGLDPSNATKLRYGENPHQMAWCYQNPTRQGLASVTPIQGKELSYNNLLDADSAMRCVFDLHNLTTDKFRSAVTIIKHANPCGAAISTDSLSALEMAWSGDPISSFGSIICFNTPVEEDVANWLQGRFVEVVIAPRFSAKALAIFTKKKNLRVIEIDLITQNFDDHMLRAISGGWVVQTEDLGLDVELKSATKNTFETHHNELAQFGIMVTKHLRSNAIAIVKSSEQGLYLIGAGMGNPNRIVSLKQAVEKAKENGHESLTDTVLISDAFFPFKDNIELAHSFGINCIVQPGGSIKDAEVIRACDEYNMKMVFTGRRHFRH